MEYPVEKEGIRIYSYYFDGIEKPVKVEAYNKMQSREILKGLVEKLPEIYRQSKIVGESVTIPLKGITEKIVKGVKYVWVGEDKSKGGWMDEKKYLESIKSNKL